MLARIKRYTKKWKNQKKNRKNKVSVLGRSEGHFITKVNFTRFWGASSFTAADKILSVFPSFVPRTNIHSADNSNISFATLLYEVMLGLRRGADSGD